MLLLQLFWVFFIVGLFCFGGGYAALPLIQARVVDGHHWLTMAEFVDITTISQMTPGPIGINAATFVGMKQAGVLGSIAATLGFVVPSAIIVLTISHFYFKYRSMKTFQGVLGGLRPAVVALIGRAAWLILREAFWGTAAIGFGTLDLVAVGIAALGLVVLGKTKLGPMTVIISGGALGIIFYSIVGM